MNTGEQYRQRQFISPLHLPIEGYRAALKATAAILSIELLRVFLHEYVRDEQYEEAAIIKAELDNRPVGTPLA